MDKSNQPPASIDTPAIPGGRKHYLQSKTIWFNIALALFAVISTHTDLLREYMSDGGYMLVLMLVSAGNTYLRCITKQGVSK
ncbi:MAG: hypothetical protein GQ532_18335 [Methylomarinum sp.]|nr:hypothetical protein [Methylomarinum sp.]